METRVFIFDQLHDGQLGVKAGPPGGNVQTFDQVCESEGWSPLHWSDISEELVVRYRVVMRRQKSQP